ncbi:Hydroquinone glucosyltransferase [Sesamum alatum]|uniref:Hydroquinone glucosyltransferase n=1 Tax=Sesamum alatum TaxID=300844 RepID=A0AAE1XUX5_9LAMI|nr:Hydroquinone glucosyltransferase [Sesamum alatum]
MNAYYLIIRPTSSNPIAIQSLTLTFSYMEPAAGLPPHIVVLPSPGMGHLIPIIEFAKKLHHHHRISTTLIMSTSAPLSKTQNTLFSTLPPGIDYIHLPPINLDDLPANARMETRTSHTVIRSLPSLRDAVKSLLERTRLAALVVDLFGTDAFEVALEFKIPPYVFFPSSAMALSLCLYLPKLDETVSCEYREVTEKLLIPGCTPIHGRDLLSPVQDRKNDAYKWVLHHTKRYTMAEGIILNSFKELEPGRLKLCMKRTRKPVVYPIGPLIRMGSKSEVDESSVCVKWLDEQPSGSVLYVSFGSGGTLSHDQMVELALGLEMSEHRFLWMGSWRGPREGVYWCPCGRPRLRFSPMCQRVHSDTLWVELDSKRVLVNGVPMIAWPLYAEQRMNAVMLHEDVRVALRPNFGENGLVGRDEIANTIKSLVEGEEGKEIRSQMMKLKDAAAKVLSENGSSTKFLAQLATKWNSNTSM